MSASFTKANIYHVFLNKHLSPDIISLTYSFSKLGIVCRDNIPHMMPMPDCFAQGQVKGKVKVPPPTTTWCKMSLETLRVEMTPTTLIILAVHLFFFILIFTAGALHLFLHLFQLVQVHSSNQLKVTAYLKKRFKGKLRLINSRLTGLFLEERTFQWILPEWTKGAY